MLGVCCVLAGAVSSEGTAAPEGVVAEGSKRIAEGEGIAFTSHVVPFLKQYCLACHGEKKQRAELNLAVFTDAGQVIRERTIWEKVAKMLREREMPPPKRPQPAEALRADIAEWIEAKLAEFDCSGPVDPGRVTIGRLNRAEYNNTVRDLFNIDLRPADDFPEDDVGYGFDNIGDVLALPPLLTEKYLDAADTIVDRVVDLEKGLSFRERFEAERADTNTETDLVGNDALALNKEGEIYFDCNIPSDGEYELRVRAYGQQAGPDVVRMAIRIDGKDVSTVSVAAVKKSPQVYTARAHIEAGKRRYSVAYLNNYFKSIPQDRNLVVDWLEVVRLVEDGRSLPWKIFVCEPTAAKSDEKPDYATCARRILARFARRAFRRPILEDELERLVDLVSSAIEAGDSFADAVRLALKAILVSPHFIFKVELDPASDVPGAVPVGDYELASRLSYFLWSSMPDEELFLAAEAGRLRDENELRAQVLRMLADARSRALIENFFGQWLQTRRLSAAAPDPELFPEVDAELLQAMRQETELFAATILREDRSLLDLIDADFTYLNERLARHYGIDGVAGEDFRRVPLRKNDRGGILTQASILTLTSSPTRTSPVARGKWILEQILGTPPPPPPPNVENLDESREAVLTGSLRERMERHRADPKCANCHAEMDALGFALENFDAVGAWRQFDGKFLIDASGALPGGETFDGPAALKRLLLKNPERFGRVLVEKMLTYALGRGLEYYDKCAADQIVDGLSAGDYRFSSLILGIVQTTPFLMKRGPMKRGPLPPERTASEASE